MGSPQWSENTLLPLQRAGGCSTGNEPVSVKIECPVAGRRKDQSGFSTGLSQLFRLVLPGLFLNLVIERLTSKQPIFPREVVPVTTINIAHGSISDCFCFLRLL